MLLWFAFVRNNSKTSRWFPFIKSVTICNWFLRYYFTRAFFLQERFFYVLRERQERYYFTNSNALDERKLATGFAVIPYIQGVTEPIKRILNSHNVKVAQKPFQTLGHIFAKPKDPVTKEQRNDAIYSIPSPSCLTL